MEPVVAAHIETKNLVLRLRSPEEVRAWVAGLDASVKKELSESWLRRVAEATRADPWLHGFSIVQRATGTTIGSVSFKAPPDADGSVEIAYAVDPDHQRHGYATEAADALTTYAFATGRVRIVRAHTLPEPNASTRVLTKCGFRFVGDVVDPEDGLVWRWEKSI
jgi:RimJ/RimL family protein N-acetyltransferase